MRKSLLAVAALLVSGRSGIAQDKSSIAAHPATEHTEVLMVQATAQQIKKAVLAIFARNGYSIDSDTPSQLKISKPFSDEETAAYNTAHWTSQPVANCRHVNDFLLSPTPINEAISVTMAREMVCNYDGTRMIRRNEDEKDSQLIHNTLTDLKARLEETSRRH